MIATNEDRFKKEIWDSDQQVWADEHAEVEEDGSIRFRLTFDADRSYEDVVVKDYLPATVRYVSASPAPTSVQFKIYFNHVTMKYIPYTLLTWDLGDISSSYNIDFEIDGVVEYLNKPYFSLPDDEYPIQYFTRNYAEFRGIARSPGCGNRYSVKYGADATYTIIPSQCEPDIEIKKYVKLNCNGAYNDNGITATIDEWVTFKLEVTNNGDYPLDVTVTDHLPDGLTYDNNAIVDGSPQEPSFIDDYTFSWYLGILDADEKVTITFKAQVDDCGILTNIAEVNGTYQDTILTDQDSATVTVDCEPNVTIEKLVREDCSNKWQEHVNIGLGDEVVFKLLVENTGDTTLDIIIVDTLPDNLEYVSGSANYTPFHIDNGVITWIFNGFPPSVQPLEITFKAIAVGCGPGINWAYMSDREQNVFDEDSATINVICPPDLEVIKTVFDGCEWVDETTAVVGEKVHFRFVVKNTGLSPLYNFTAVDTLPAGLTYDDNATVDGVLREPDEIIPNPDGTTTLIWYFSCDTCDPRCQLYPVIPDPCGGNGVFVPCDPECCGLCYPNPDDPNPQPYPVGVQCGYCVPDSECDPRCHGVSEFDPCVQQPDWVDCNPECCWGDGPRPISAVCGYNLGDFIEKPIPVPLYESCNCDSNEIITTSSIVPQPYCPCECFELYPQETIVIEFDAIVEDCGILENNVVVTGNDKITDEQLKDEDNATVNVACEPGISVDKKVKWNCCGEYDDYIMVHEDDWVTFKIETTNTGEVPLDIRVELDLYMTTMQHLVNMMI